MIFNIIALRVYKKFYDDMTQKPRSDSSHHSESQSKEGTRSNSSSERSYLERLRFEEQSKSMIDDIKRLIAPDCTEPREIARGIQKTAETMGNWFGTTTPCVRAIEQTLAAIEPVFTDPETRNSVRNSLALTVAALTSGHRPAWDGWAQFLGSDSSEEVVHAALRALSSGNPTIFGAADLRASMIDAASRSERCRQAVMALEPLFTVESFAENRGKLILLGQKSIEVCCLNRTGGSDEQIKTVQMFERANMAHELLFAAITALEGSFSEVKNTIRDVDQLRELNRVLDCFPRHLLDDTVASSQARDGLPRLEKLRDQINAAFKKSSNCPLNSPLFAQWLTHLCETIRAMHHFSTITDWRTSLIPLLTGPDQSCGAAIDKNGERLLVLFREHASSLQARVAFSELEKLFENAVVASIASPDRAGLAEVANQLDSLCSLIGGLHGLERKKTADTAAHRMYDRWLLDYAGLSTSRPTHQQLPYASQVVNVLSSRVTKIVGEIEESLRPVICDCTAELIAERGANRSRFDFIGITRDILALLSISWWKTAYISKSLMQLLEVMPPAKRVEKLVRLTQRCHFHRKRRRC